MSRSTQYFRCQIYLLWVALGLLVSASAPVAANTVIADMIGNWESAEPSFEVQIESCGEALCGTVVRSTQTPGSDAAPKVGWKLLSSFQTTEESEWSGEMHNFRNGKNYQCVMRLISPNELLVRPYVGLRLFGKDHIWRRVSEAPR